MQTLQTPREYLVKLGLAKPGRGKFSAQAHAELKKATKSGVKFAEPAAPVKPTKKAAAKRTAATPPKAAVTKPIERPAEPEPKRSVDPSLVRKWAKEEGIDVNDRGRLSAEIVSKYLAANPDAPTAADRANIVSGVFAAAEPRYPYGTRFSGKDSTGKKHVLGDAVTCFTCSYSLSHCGCRESLVLCSAGEYIVVSRAY